MLLHDVQRALHDAFIKFTGYSCTDASYKVALLSLKHPCAVAIDNEFNEKKALFQRLPYLLNWETGRLGQFIVDTIESEQVCIKDVRRYAKKLRLRNDCCGRKNTTAYMCSICKIAMCDSCMRKRRTNEASRYSGLNPTCACLYKDPRKLMSASAAYMLECVDQTGGLELRPVCLVSHEIQHLWGATE